MDGKVSVGEDDNSVKVIKNNSKFKFKKNHLKFGYEEPIISFVPSILINSLIKILMIFLNFGKKIFL